MQYTISDKPLTLEDFKNVIINKYYVNYDDGVKQKIIKCRNILENNILQNKVMYGINTGFGSLKNVMIESEDMELLQYKLIVSHANGIGNCIPHAIIRGMLFLRLYSFSKGFSGITIELFDNLINFLNKDFISFVPEKGSCGASGDLIPLSHLFSGMLGLGTAFDSESKTFIDSKIVLGKLNLQPLNLKAKEGLALINGTQFMTSYMAYIMIYANKLKELSNLIACCSIEALHGTKKAFDSRIHNIKPHKQQINVAKYMYNTLSENSEIQQTFTSVQDSYSLRCVPQIHGIAHQLINDVTKIVLTEMNSVTDNPCIFDNDVLSGGNFHGQYIGTSSDILAIALVHLCNISERRTEQLVNNNILPPFLVSKSGINCGCMIFQYCAASITAANRHLANPQTIHSIPTCANVEDIVSMGASACVRALTMLENTFSVLSYELICALQALEFTTEKPCDKVKEIHNHVRNVLKVPFIDKDMYFHPFIKVVYDYLFNQNINH